MSVVRTQQSRISIIIPSWNDVRIVQAIKTVRRFDDIGVVDLLVIDGGSRPEILRMLRPLMAPRDTLVSEPDQGIFDGLNKGLERVQTEYLGWLGSDDFFTGQVKASDVFAALHDADIFVSSLAMFRGRRVRRLFDARVVGWGLVHYGLHNPHYSTFGRTELLAQHRFPAAGKGGDIAYFLDVFAQRPRVATSPRIAVAMCEGGVSNSSRARILEMNRHLFTVYRDRVGPAGAAIAIALKLGWKIGGRVEAILRPRNLPDILA